MDEASITQYITDTFDGVDVVVGSGNTFFFYDPARKLPPERRMPFATFVTNDNYDRASHLSRPSVFRLNLGVSKDTYRSLFGPQPSPPGAAGVVDTGHDFTALDQILPHPVYAHLSWVCVLNPSDATFREVVRPLLAEAYDLAAGKYAKRAARDKP
jgi:hypothetical protein